MRYTIEYKQKLLKDRLTAALKDVKEYLGEDKYQGLLSAAAADPSLTFAQFRFALSFVGIEGLPVRAVWHEVLKLR